MAVIIHEFEVDVQPESQPSGAAPVAPSVSTPQVGAQEIEHIMRRQLERFERLRAH
jgi:hypothetical protein